MKKNLKLKKGLFTAAFSIGVILIQPGLAQSSKKRIDASAFYQKVKNNPNALIIDVRPAYKFQENRIEGAVLAESQKELEALTANANKKRVILVYCQIGDRSNKACKVLRQNGFIHVYELDEGLETWIESDYPLDTEVLE